MRRKYKQVWMVMFCYDGRSEVFQSCHATEKMARSAMLETARSLAENFTVLGSEVNCGPDSEDSPDRIMRIVRRAMQVC